MVGQAHASDLAKGRIRLLRCHRADLRAHPALLRRAARNLQCAILLGVKGELQRRGLALLGLLAPALAHELINGRQGTLPYIVGTELTISMRLQNNSGNMSGNNGPDPLTGLVT